MRFAHNSKAMCGWLRPCTLGDSSLLVQRRVTRRKDPRSLRRAHTARSPARLAAAGHSPNSPGAHNAPRAQSKVSRLPPALLGARLAPTGGLKQHPSCFTQSWLQIPVTAEHPSSVGWGSRCSPQPTELWWESSAGLDHGAVSVNRAFPPTKEDCRDQRPLRK